ncbi:hypothetical protein AAMO2058_001728900 [Amorphochlora amoebiformis]
MDETEENQISTWVYDPADWTPMQKLHWYKKNRIPEWGEFFAALFVLAILLAIFYRHVLSPLLELRRMRISDSEEAKTEEMTDTLATTDTNGEGAAEIRDTDPKVKKDQ